MTLRTPLWQEIPTYSATADRELIDASFTAGLIGATDLAVSQRGAGANMSVDVAVGSCVVTGTDAVGQGKYLCKSDAVVNITIATSPGVGNSRIDLIVAQVRDADQNLGANNDWVLVAVTGATAATGSQVAPAPPASSLVLAHIAVGPTVATIVNANVTSMNATATAPAGSRSLSRLHIAPLTTPTQSAVFGSTVSTNFTALGTSVWTFPGFSLPASGAVEVTMKGLIAAGAACDAFLAFFGHGGTTKYGDTATIFMPGMPTTSAVTFSVAIIISGTPGAVIPQLDIYGTSDGSSVGVQIDAMDTGGSTSAAPVGSSAPFDLVVRPL